MVLPIIQEPTFTIMGKYRKLSHTVYKCEYHIVWTPKYRYRILKDGLASELQRDLYGLSSMKDVLIEELNIQPDHVHLFCSIPPKLSVSAYMGFLKGKSAIKIMQSYTNLRKKVYWGNHFWTRGYFVSTVGLDADLIRRYVKYQEKLERDQERNSGQNTLF